MAGAGQAYDEKQLAAGVRETDDNISPSVSNGQKYFFFFQVWDKTVGRRRQALAIYIMDPPDVFEAVIYTRWPCPTPSELTVG